MSTIRERRPTVQLRHELPDGTAHVDWMLGQDPAGRERLITFRVPCRVDGLEPGGEPDAVRAERIADHRPMYLTFEGPVSGGRGVVRRLRRGEIVGWTRVPGRWELTVVWAPGAGDSGGTGAEQRLRLRQLEGDRWEIRAV